MKTTIYKANTRGFANHGWLQANYSFSFANYYNPDRMQFGALRVLNDDLIAPSMGFGMHPHDNMEIITIPLKGVLKHKDSMHNEWQEVKPGEVQVMSAGTGIVHSEINGSPNEYLSLFQIWIIPNTKDVKPRYDQKSFSENNRKNNFQTLVTSTNDTASESLKIHQDAVISRIDLSENKSATYSLKYKNNGVYAMVINGKVSIAEHQLESRDAIGVENTNEFNITALTDSELLLIEVPMA